MPIHPFSRRLGLGATLLLGSLLASAQQVAPAPPLYVVDGFWFPRGTQESFFVPGEIQSAGVYKDAAAMHQRYGTDAANGVLELKLSTPFLLNGQLLRTPQAKARALRQHPAQRVLAVRRLSVEESKAYVGSSGQTVLVITPAQ